MCIPSISRTQLTTRWQWATSRNLSQVPKTPHPKNGPLLPSYCISFESLKLDVGPLVKGVHFIDARHYNANLIMPRLVYILPTKLKGDVLHKCLGHDYDLKRIKFITRYGYATRPNLYCKLRGAYATYTDMHNATYINNCDDVNRIIPVPLFWVMLFNACFTYQLKNVDIGLVEKPFQHTCLYHLQDCVVNGD